MTMSTYTLRVVLIAGAGLISACASQRSIQRDANPKWCAPGVRAEHNGEQTSSVDAEIEWNYTGIPIARGARYEIRIAPDPLEDWVDWFVPATPENGWQGLAGAVGWLFQWNARYDKAPMYSLVCTVGRRPGGLDFASRPPDADGPLSYFRIGAQRPVDAPNSGELVCFANDWEGRFANNHGCVELTGSTNTGIVRARQEL